MKVKRTQEVQTTFADLEPGDIFELTSGGPLFMVVDDPGDSHGVIGLSNGNRYPCLQNGDPVFYYPNAKLVLGRHGPKKKSRSRGDGNAGESVGQD